MNTTLRVLATSLAVLLVAGCNRDGLQLPKAVGEGNQGEAGGQPADPYLVSGTAGKVGAAIDDQGDIMEPKVVFSPNETVYLSMDAKGRRPGDRVRVYWFHQDGISRREEEKQVEGPFVAFDYAPTETGKFNVEIDVNEKPIGLVDFEVK